MLLAVASPRAKSPLTNLAPSEASTTQSYAMPPATSGKDSHPPAVDPCTVGSGFPASRRTLAAAAMSASCKRMNVLHNIAQDNEREEKGEGKRSKGHRYSSKKRLRFLVVRDAPGTRAISMRFDGYDDHNDAERKRFCIII